MENHKLFVGNLSYEATEEDVRSLIAAHGVIFELRLTKKKGCAFVDMATAGEAIAVIAALNEKEFMGRKLKVRPELPTKKAKSLARKQFKDQKKKIEAEKKARKREDAGE